MIFEQSSKHTGPLLAVFGVLLCVGIVYLLWSSFFSPRADESAEVKVIVQNFGFTLKNVSLLSPGAPDAIRENYGDFLTPELLAEWQADPSKAVGRYTSSPWPDRIAVAAANKSESGAYDVFGEIIEVTSMESIGDIASKRSIKLRVEKIDAKWRITSVIAGNTDNYIAAQLRECMPQSDMGSKEKCDRLIKEINNFDACVAAGFSILKSNPPQCALPDGRTFTQNTNSTWEMAVLAVNKCEVEKAFQTHRLLVTLKLKNGATLTATEPAIDAIFNVLEGAEGKCG